MENRGYYSVASRRWVTWQEVEAANTAVVALQAEVSAAAKRRAATEALADAEAAKGNYDKAREILARR